MKHLLLVVALLCPLAACSAGGVDDPAEDSAGVTLTVFAAASLQDTFTEIGRQFEAEHAGVSVTFSFAGSSDLLAQIEQGAPADVFASADADTMVSARNAGLLDGAAQDFATNTLQIATPAGNPADVQTLEDLADERVRTVVCAPQVPCGAAAVRVQKAAGVDIPAVSEEQSVTDVLGKIISGEADAGLVYVTDVEAAGDRVNGIDLPQPADVVQNTYPIATVEGRAGEGLAKAFIAYVNGVKGQAVLAAAGFGRP